MSYTPVFALTDCPVAGCSHRHGVRALRPALDLAPLGAGVAETSADRSVTRSSLPPAGPRDSVQAVPGTRATVGES